jgi:hypothetical protein
VRITRVRVRDFRVHRDLDLELAPGLTVIRGPNEAGKTTLQRALEVGLFRRVTAGGSEIDNLRSWDAGEDGRPAVQLDFIQEDPEGTRVGSVLKDFRGSKGTVRLDLDGQTTTDPARADELLAELTGIPSEKFFRSTASVRHHEVDDLARDEGALRDRLQASISGADRGTSAVKRRLDRTLRDLHAKGDKNPGRLRIAEQAVVRAEAVVSDGEARLAGLERDRDALVLARDHRAQVDASLAERRSLLEKARQAERLTAEREVARERFERYRQAVAVSDEIVSLEQGHPSGHALPVLRQVVERLRVLDREIAALRAQLGDGPSAVDYEVVIPEPRWRRFAIAAGVLAVGGLAAGIIGFVTGQFPALIGGLAAAVLGAISSSRSCLWRRKSDAAPPRPQPARGGPEAASHGPRRPAGIARAGRSSGRRGPPDPRGRPRPGDRARAGAAGRARGEGPAGDAPDPPRRRGARNRAEDRRARSPRADREGAPRPRAAGGGGPRPGGRPGAGA